MTRLDERLAQVAVLVRVGKSTVDVGTDHGQLLVQLVQEGKIPGGVACDIGEKPLEKARLAVGLAGLSQQIDCRISDGLAAIAPHEGEDVVIAGMGGDLIARIVQETSWLRDPQRHLVLQPMTKAEHLRTALAQGGFSTVGEYAVESGRFVYTVFSVVYVGEGKPLTPLEEWVGKVVEGNTPDTGKYLARVEESLLQKAQGLEKSPGKQAEAEQWNALAKQIAGLREEWQDEYDRKCI